MYSQTENPQLGFLGLHSQLCAPLAYHKSQDLDCDCHSLKAHVFMWMLRMSRELDQTQPKENILIYNRNFCKSAPPMFLMWQTGIRCYHPTLKPETCLSAIQPVTKFSSFYPSFGGSSPLTWTISETSHLLFSLRIPPHTPLTETKFWSQISSSKQPCIFTPTQTNVIFWMHYDIKHLGKYCPKE